MFRYEKKLEYPVCINHRNLKLAQAILTQFGGPGGELSASLQYWTQRYSMPDDLGKSLLTDISIEELGHIEIINSIVYQLMKGASINEIKEEGLMNYYAQFGTGLFPSDSMGNPWTADYISSTGDAIADLELDMAAEQKARATYEHLMNLTNDPEVLAPLAFLRQREIIHYIRFKELRDYYLNTK